MANARSSSSRATRVTASSSPENRGLLRTAWEATPSSTTMERSPRPSTLRRYGCTIASRSAASARSAASPASRSVAANRAVFQDPAETRGLTTTSPLKPRAAHTSASDASLPRSTNAVGTMGTPRAASSPR